MIKRAKFYHQKMVSDRGINVCILHDVYASDGYTIADNRVGIKVTGHDIPSGDSVTVPWPGVEFIQEDEAAPVQAQAQGKGGK